MTTHPGGSGDSAGRGGGGRNSKCLCSTEALPLHQCLLKPVPGSGGPSRPDPQAATPGEGKDCLRSEAGWAANVLGERDLGPRAPEWAGLPWRVLCPPAGLASPKGRRKARQTPQERPLHTQASPRLRTLRASWRPQAPRNPRTCWCARVWFCSKIHPSIS